MTFVQLVLGAGFRHSAIGIAPHLAGAAAVLALVVISGRVVRRRFAGVGVLLRLTVWLNAVVGVQILLGGAALWSRIATREAPQPQAVTIWLTVAHTVVGAVVLASTVAFALVCHRMFTAAHEPAVVSGVSQSGATV